MKAKRVFICAAAAMILCGCQQNPDSGIVVHKDMEKVISEAENSGEGKVDLDELRQDSHYTASFENQSLHVKVSADADIFTPDAERLSVIHVEKAQFSQAFTDKLRAQLIGDQPICDGRVCTMRAKADVLKEIGALREMMNNPPPDDTEIYLKEYQQALDNLQLEYDAAPEELVYTDYPSDGLLHPIRELYEQEKAVQGGKELSSSYYASRYEMEPNGEMLRCVTDGTDGMYSDLYVQNSPDSSSFVAFSRTPLGLGNIGDVGLSFVVCKPSMLCGLPANTLAIYGGYRHEYRALPDNTAELSQADAQKQAEQLLSALGLEAFSYYEGGLFTEVGSIQYNNSITGSEDTPLYYRTCYILRYFRSIDGVPLLRGGSKEGEADANYRRKRWDDEMIEIRVDDNGIIGFYYGSPLNMLETTVSDAAMKPFSEIKETFEKMAPMMTAEENGTFRVETAVDRVELSYIRIAEKDSFDTGYAVPVWGFYGSRSLINDHGERMEGVFGSNLLMSINAIDGSVIVPGAGY